jgi:hypothetical protein
LEGTPAQAFRCRHLLPLRAIHEPPAGAFPGQTRMASLPAPGQRPGPLNFRPRRPSFIPPFIQLSPFQAPKPSPRSSSIYKTTELYRRFHRTAEV